MSKEQLKGIKQYYSRMDTLDPCTQSDIRWLIEQVERVERQDFALKVLYKHDKINQSEIERLQDENEALAVAMNDAKREIMILKNQNYLLRAASK